MPDVEAMTDAELEQLRRAVLDEQEARALRQRAEAQQSAHAASARADLATGLHRFLDAGGIVDDVLALAQVVAQEHWNSGRGRDRERP